MKYFQEKIIPGPNQSFITHDVIGPVIDCTLHVHPEYEIVYVASSFGTRFVGDNVSMFDIGNLTLVGPMVPHHYYNSPEDSQSSTWGHTRVIQFKENFAGSPLFGIPEMKPIKKMLEDSSYGLSFNEATSAAAKPVMSRLFEASGPDRVVILLEFLALLAASQYTKLSSIPGSQNTPPGQTQRMDEVLSYIHQKLLKGQPLSLNRVAARVNMNPQSFSRYFRKATFKRFIDYVNEVKIGKACRLLIDTDKTVSEICFEAGFNNLSNFNRQFFKLKQMTPKELRNNFRKHQK